jgi:hypothetical protein
MAKVWVKGFTKDDGTKVKGHYREIPDLYGSRKEQKTFAKKVQMTGNLDGSYQRMILQAGRWKRKQSSPAIKRWAGANYAKGINLKIKE